MTSGGLELALFLPGADAPFEKDPMEYFNGLNVTKVLSQRLDEWIRSEAARRLGKETSR